MHMVKSTYDSGEFEQLDVALILCAKDSDVVVQPQGSVLDIERETSANDPRVERDGETIVINGSAHTSELDIGKERNARINTDTDGIVVSVDSDDDLPKPAVSNLAQEHYHPSRITVIVTGPKPKLME